MASGGNTRPGLELDHSLGSGFFPDLVEGDDFGNISEFSDSSEDDSDFTTSFINYAATSENLNSPEHRMQNQVGESRKDERLLTEEAKIGSKDTRKESERSAASTSLFQVLSDSNASPEAILDVLENLSIREYTTTGTSVEMVMTSLVKVMDHFSNILVLQNQSCELLRDLAYSEEYKMKMFDTGVAQRIVDFLCTLSNDGHWDSTGMENGILTRTEEFQLCLKLLSALCHSPSSRKNLVNLGLIAGLSTLLKITSVEVVGSGEYYQHVQDTNTTETRDSAKQFVQADLQSVLTLACGILRTLAFDDQSKTALLQQGAVAATVLAVNLAPDSRELVQNVLGMYYLLVFQVELEIIDARVESSTNAQDVVSTAEEMVTVTVKAVERFENDVEDVSEAFGHDDLHSHGIAVLGALLAGEVGEQNPSLLEVVAKNAVVKSTAATMRAKHNDYEVLADGISVLHAVLENEDARKIVQERTPLKILKDTLDTVVAAMGTHIGAGGDEDMQETGEHLLTSLCKLVEANECRETSTSGNEDHSTLGNSTSAPNHTSNGMRCTTEPLGEDPLPGDGEIVSEVDSLIDESTTPTVEEMDSSSDEACDKGSSSSVSSKQPGILVSNEGQVEVKPAGGEKDLSDKPHSDTPKLCVVDKQQDTKVFGEEIVANDFSNSEQDEQLIASSTPPFVDGNKQLRATEANYSKQIGEPTLDSRDGEELSTHEYEDEDLSLSSSFSGADQEIVLFERHSVDENAGRALESVEQSESDNTYPLSNNAEHTAPSRLPGESLVAALDRHLPRVPSVESIADLLSDPSISEEVYSDCEFENSSNAFSQSDSSLEIAITGIDSKSKEPTTIDNLGVESLQSSVQEETLAEKITDKEFHSMGGLPETDSMDAVVVLQAEEDKLPSEPSAANFNTPPQLSEKYLQRSSLNEVPFESSFELSGDENFARTNVEMETEKSDTHQEVRMLRMNTLVMLLHSQIRSWALRTKNQYFRRWVHTTGVQCGDQKITTHNIVAQCETGKESNLPRYQNRARALCLYNTLTKRMKDPSDIEHLKQAWQVWANYAWRCSSQVKKEVLPKLYSDSAATSAQANMLLEELDSLRAELSRSSVDKKTAQAQGIEENTQKDSVICALKDQLLEAENQVQSMRLELENIQAASSTRIQNAEKEIENLKQNHLELETKRKRKDSEHANIVKQHVETMEEKVRLEDSLRMELAEVNGLLVTEKNLRAKLQGEVKSLRIDKSHSDQMFEQLETAFAEKQTTPFTNASVEVDPSAPTFHDSDTIEKKETDIASTQPFPQSLTTQTPVRQLTEHVQRFISTKDSQMRLEPKNDDVDQENKGSNDGDDEQTRTLRRLVKELQVAKSELTAHKNRDESEFQRQIQIARSRVEDDYLLVVKGMAAQSLHEKQSKSRAVHFQNGDSIGSIAPGRNYGAVNETNPLTERSSSSSVFSKSTEPFTRNQLFGSQREKRGFQTTQLEADGVGHEIIPGNNFSLHHKPNARTSITTENSGSIDHQGLDLSVGFAETKSEAEFGLNHKAHTNTSRQSYRDQTERHGGANNLSDFIRIRSVDSLVETLFKCISATGRTVDRVSASQVARFVQKAKLKTPRMVAADIHVMIAGFRLDEESSSNKLRRSSSRRGAKWFTKEELVRFLGELVHKMLISGVLSGNTTTRAVLQSDPDHLSYSQAWDLLSCLISNRMGTIYEPLAHVIAKSTLDPVVVSTFSRQTCGSQLMAPLMQAHRGVNETSHSRAYQSPGQKLSDQGKVSYILQRESKPLHIIFEQYATSRQQGGQVTRSQLDGVTVMHAKQNAMDFSAFSLMMKDFKLSPDLVRRARAKDLFVSRTSATRGRLEYHGWISLLLTVAAESFPIEDGFESRAARLLALLQWMDASQGKDKLRKIRSNVVVRKFRLN